MLSASNENVPHVRAEAGCISYGAAIDASGFSAFQAPVGPDTFVVVEQWVSAEALTAHISAPHMKEYAAKTKDLLAARAINVLTPA
ncbi:MAG: hypothetical protein NVSMB64_20360 [Candidatus Velthaea sp.]